MIAMRVRKAYKYIMFGVFKPKKYISNLLPFFVSSLIPFDLSVGIRDCGCQDWHGCIMRPSVMGEEGIQPYKFSTCSRKEFDGYLGDGRLLCLLNNPNTIRYQTSSRNCGNSIVDPGEECDCGTIAQCDNSCCDPITCQLKQKAECAAGECCDVINCKV